LAVQSLALFALAASADLGRHVAAQLGIELGRLEERNFEDGEHKVRPLQSVRGQDVYVLQSLYGEPGASPDDKLVRLLFLLGALRDAGAQRLTAVVPYLCYMRKEARTQPRDGLSSRYIAQLLEALGVDRIVALEVHNPAAYSNAFRIAAEHLSSGPLLADHLAATLAPAEEVTVVSPDPGGFKRADRLRTVLEKRLRRDVEFALMEKRRARGELSGGRLVGSVSGRTAIIVDDIVASGSTLAAAARACRIGGARRVIAAAAHGLFVSPANRVLSGNELDRLIVTDSVPPFRLDMDLLQRKVEFVSIAPLLGTAVERLHSNGSLVELLEQ
jgi:ribose-phosphate pyrophosphokinase